MKQLKIALIILFLSQTLLNNINYWLAADTWSGTVLTWNTTKTSSQTSLTGSSLSWTVDTSKNADTKTAKTVDAFHDKKMDLINNLYESNPVNTLTDTNEAKDQLDIMSKQFDGIVDEYEQVKDKRKDLITKYRDVAISLSWVVQDVKQSKIEMERRIEKMKQYDDALKKLRLKLIDLRDDLQNTKANLARYTNLLYEINNDFYGKDLNIDDLKLLVKSDSIVKTLSDEDITKAITLKMEELIWLLNQTKEKYTDYNTKINELNLKYWEELESYKQDLATLSQQKKYLYQILLLIKENKTDLDNRLKTLDDDRVQVREQIINVISAIKTSWGKLKESQLAWVNKLFAEDDGDDGDKFFSWPVLNPKRITAFFDDKSYYKMFGVWHKAIDIGVPQGTEVYAPANGIVYKVVNQDSPSTNRFMVVHKYWYVTVYIHTTQIFVKEWDYVRRWQLIALSWWKPWTRWAWYLTTGPHLHFEVIKNAQYVDPLTTLDLSVFSSEKSLLDKYQLKYFQDRNDRQIDLSNISSMQWSSVRERRVNFLNSFAAPAFKDVSMWEDAAKMSDVDVDVWICIWFAETSLWKHMASQRNVGNVWNNDRWDRKWFWWPEYGVQSIYNTLMNKYLWNYVSLDQLSRFGNKEGSIYASSDFNWHKNIVRCLTKIKWYRVPERYFFRKYKPQQ